MRVHIVRIGLLCVVWVCACASMVSAQPVPVLRSASPDIVLPGKVTEVTLTGENLLETRQVLLDQTRGVSLTIASDKPDAKQIKLRVDVKPDALRGDFNVRAATATGVSAPLALTISDHPPVYEKEPNNSIGQAQAVELPAIIVGSIHAQAEADLYKFSARAGQRLIFDVVAQRHGSKLDSSLAILDAGAAVLARGEDEYGLDSFIEFTAPKDGDYFLRIHDLRYQGAGDFTYRIRGGAIPHVASLFPLGGRRGGYLDVQLIGANLPSAYVPLKLAPDAPLGRRDVDVPTAAGVTNALPFEVGDQPEIIEAEPNEKPAQSNTVSLPVVVNGRVSREGDIDTFRFTSNSERPVRIEVAASRFGSPLDALLTLRDEKGNVLQQNDDAGGGMGADARIELKDSKDKTYTVSVTDLVGRGGERFAYRLSVLPQSPETPDFEIAFPPETPRVARDGRTKLWCEVKRRGGFNGDVTVKLEGLPNGVTCEPLVLKGNEPNSGLMVLTASNEAPLGLFPLKATATGKIGETDAIRPPKARQYGGESPSVLLTVVDAPPFVIERVGPIPGLEDPAKADAEIAELQKKLEAPTPELDAAQAKWEQAVANQRWHALEIVNLTTEFQSIKLKKEADGSIVADGGDRDAYIINANTPLKKVTAFKLEAIAANGKGPGRADDGNFVVSRFILEAAPKLPPGQSVPLSRVELHKPRADFNQGGYHIEETLKEGTRAGWAVHPQTLQSHWGIWETKTPVANDNGTALKFMLRHEYAGGPRFTLARFRILATDSEQPEGGFSPPDTALAIIYTPAEQRSDAQKQELAKYYRSIAPELKETRERLAQLQTTKVKFPPEMVVNQGTTLAVSVKRMGSFAGPVTLTVEGFTTGLNGQTQEPNPIANNVEVKALTLQDGQSFGAISVKAKPNSEKGTRAVVIRADATVDGHQYTQYSPLIPMTVKEPPPKEEKKDEKKGSAEALRRRISAPSIPGSGHSRLDRCRPDLAAHAPHAPMTNCAPAESPWQHQSTFPLEIWIRSRTSTICVASSSPWRCSMRS